jgi:hypothetical protein
MRTNTRKHPVISSNLAFVGYSRKYGVLDITFQNGNTYRYFNVPRKMYDRLMKASSKGVFYNTYIKGNVDYAPVKLENINSNPKPLFNKVTSIYLKDNRYLVVNGLTGIVVRISSTVDWAEKDAIDFANKYPGTPYYALSVLGEASTRAKATFVEK